MSHVKRDRSCRWACPILLGRTQATGGSVAGARPGATISALGLGGPNTCHSARSTRKRDKDLLSSGRAKALSAGRPLLPYGEEPPASPLAGRRRSQPLSRLQIARTVAFLSQRRWERGSREPCWVGAPTAWRRQELLLR
jgi:hypothetical protein